MGRKKGKRQSDPSRDDAESTDTELDDGHESVIHVACPHVGKAVQLANIKKSLKVAWVRVGQCSQCFKEQQAKSPSNIHLKRVKNEVLRRELGGKLSAQEIKRLQLERAKEERKAAADKLRKIGESTGVEQSCNNEDEDVAAESEKKTEDEKKEPDAKPEAPKEVEGSAESTEKAEEKVEAEPKESIVSKAMTQVKSLVGCLQSVVLTIVGKITSLISCVVGKTTSLTNCLVNHISALPWNCITSTAICFGTKVALTYSLWHLTEDFAVFVFPVIDVVVPAFIAKAKEKQLLTDNAGHIVSESASLVAGCTHYYIFRTYSAVASA